MVELFFTFTKSESGGKTGVVIGLIDQARGDTWVNKEVARFHQLRRINTDGGAGWIPDRAGNNVHLHQ